MHFPTEPTYERSRSLKQWIYANIRSIRTIDEVADAFGMKANTLRKYFRKHEGKSLSTFLKEARVDAMKEMLRTSELCCFEIADRFQYAQDASAERMFKRATGMTMGEYREMHGNACNQAACMDKSKAEQSRAEQSRAVQRESNLLRSIRRL